MRFPIHIRDNDLSILLDYEVFLDYHAGQALLGAIVGWRAMEQASVLLSRERLWDRAELSVSARHAGPGVRDALEYVTRCFTRERFHAETGSGAGPCGSAADFRFTVSDGARVVQLELSPGIVPESFFTAVRQCRAESTADARAELQRQKALSAAVVAGRPLWTLFRCTETELTPMAKTGHA